MIDPGTIHSIKMRYGIVGRTEALDQALSRAIRVSKTDLSVLIHGESGVGKEVFSKIIHEQSKRKHNPFIAINCGAIPAGTINSELFGHEKGSFTSASGERKGYFETANGGTIFLDEIGEMPLDTQSFLLRVLESGEFLRVGSSQVLKTDVRVVAATNVDLKEKIQSGKFREDLFYRLNTVPIAIPALRERRDDILLLFRRFAIDFSEKYRSKLIEIDERSEALLRNYSWPGNIRELKNLAEQTSVLSEKQKISAEDLVKIKPELLERHLPAIASGGQKSDDFSEREILYKVLFEMKKDLGELKNFVMELVNRNDLSFPNRGELKQLAGSDDYPGNFDNDSNKTMAEFFREDGGRDESHTSIVINEVGKQSAREEPEVEETLSLEDNEKLLIKKALEKHRGKRKDAALELGISERTLYRKIKQYEINA